MWVFQALGSAHYMHHNLMSPADWVAASWIQAAHKEKQNLPRKIFADQMSIPQVPGFLKVII